MDLEMALGRRAQVEDFQRRHRIGLLTLLFTDIVGSTRLKQELGDREAILHLDRHHTLVRELLGLFKECEEISTAGDSFFIVFAKPSDAAKFSLSLQARLALNARQTGREVFDRIGIHVGEVFITEQDGSGRTKDLYGIQVDICARVLSLAQANQILMTRFAFDSARQVLKGQELEGVGPLCWMNHGRYRLKGVDEPVEICGVGEEVKGVVTPPTNSDKAQRLDGTETDWVLGWRPAVDQTVPNTKWIIERKLGEGGFGEVWLGRHQILGERRVFKFCFRADRVRSLKREVTLFRVLKERVGHHPNIVGVQEVFFDEPPYYLVMDYAEGEDLRGWCAAQGGLEKVSQATVFEIIAQVADALQAAHDAGVIHRDVKPGNILVAGGGESPLKVRLTDFGIGQVLSPDALAGVTGRGFTQTVMTAGQGQAAGTLMYLAPELTAGHLASTRSDIYSLGVVLFQMLAGGLNRPLTMDWKRAVPDPLLQEILTLCFSGNPEERFSSAGLLARSLRSVETQRAREIEQRQTQEQAARERSEQRRRTIRRMRLSGVAAILLVAASLFFVWIRLRQGTLIVKIDPPGGRIEVKREGGPPISLPAGADGKQIQLTLAKGSYVVSVEYPGLDRSARTVEVKGRQETTETFVFEYGTVSISSQPPGANILLEGTNVMAGSAPVVTPCRLALKPGLARFALSRAGYVTTNVSSEIQAGKSYSLVVELAPSPPETTLVEFDSNPRGVVIELDGKPFVRTLETKGLPSGNYHLTARFGEGWPVRTTNLVVLNGRESKVFFYFERARISLSSEPTGATIHAGQRILGVTPTNFIWPTGAVAFRLEKTGYPSISVATNLFDGGRLDLRADLARGLAYVDGERLPAGRLPPLTNGIGMVLEWLPKVGTNGGHWVGKHEVTQTQYQRVMGNNPSTFKSGNIDRLPVDSVGVDDARRFCRELAIRDQAFLKSNAMSDWTYVLPDSAQWRYFVADAKLVDSVVGGRSPSPDRPAEVGSRGANAFGLHDVRGNVWEWCDDATLRGAAFNTVQGFKRELDLTTSVRLAPNLPSAANAGFRCVLVPGK